MANNQSVRRHLDAFTRGRIIGKLEEGRSGTRVWLQSSELLTASFHDFGDNFKLQEQLSGGSVVVVHEEPHPQMTGTLSYRPEETGGRQREKSLDTRHRRLLFIPLISLLVSIAYITHVLTYWGSYGIKCVDLESFCTKLN
ncbi:hypothetical protein TNCV_886891 [Trichonephila clavipes]|uniref:Uncharacterized protein n=1 Tax=Trichonephila clavipes TaxID=2585209 RepID=A0A8X6RE09_TRICX|nr:hypothetical protein TNCV_886891 [Trichonephila clavipes]